MKDKIVLLFMLFAFVSCNQNNDRKEFSKDLPTINTDSSKVENQANLDSSKSILSPGKDTLVLKLKMDSANQHVTVPINISGGDTLFAIVTSKDKKANIRISQVGLPNSTFDGPFGRKIGYKIKDSGDYKIIVGEDMMAGNRWNGDFTLRAWVK